MEKDNSDLGYIDDVCTALSAESIEEIDFDRLRRWLSERRADSFNHAGCIGEVPKCKTESIVCDS